MYLPAEGKGGITLSVDAISSARHVLLSAGKPAQADMVRKCLGWSNAATNTALPAGMITARPGTEVEWLLTERSALELPAL
jgi:6-phosphogluconolactonase/glucosamine-6-phosphate isomerase/deaminase